MLKKVNLIGTTATGGAVTVKSGHVCGKLIAVQWVDGDLADGVDAVLTVANSVHPVTLLTLTDANSDAWYQPRVPMHDTVGAAVTFDGTNELYTEAVVDGALQLAITSGGDAKTGGTYVWLDV